MLGRQQFRPLAAYIECRGDERPGGGRVVAIAMADNADDARRDLGAELDDLDRLVVLVDREARNERDADPGAREALDYTVLVGAEGVARLQPRCAELVEQEVGRPACPRSDQRLLCDLAQGRRAPAKAAAKAAAKKKSAPKKPTKK